MAERVRKIAVIPSNGLGDGLLWLIFANNFHRNGFEVAFFSNIIYQLRDWFTHIPIYKTPTRQELPALIKDFDLVVAEPFSVMSELADETPYQELAKQHCFIRMGIFSATTAYDQQSTKTDDPILRNIVKASGIFVTEINPEATMAENITTICKSVMGLKNVTKEIGITAPKGLKFRSYTKRVIVHPAASTPNKSWPKNKYVKLAKKLAAEGWQPLIVVAPHEALQWQRVIRKRAPLLVTQNVSDLATVLYESGYFIGNDSGPGHLASALSIPTLTLVIKAVTVWRPDWGPGQLIKAPFWEIWNTKHLRKAFLTVGRVYRSFLKNVRDFAPF